MLHKIFDIKTKFSEEIHQKDFSALIKRQKKFGENEFHKFFGACSHGDSGKRILFEVNSNL